MNRKQGKLKPKLWGITIIPLLCMGICALLISSYSIYTSMESEIRDGLNNLAHVLYHSCSNNGNYDYIMIDEIANNKQVIDDKLAILEEIKNISGVEATIFRGDERILTSVRNRDGMHAIGTYAAKEVAEVVLEQGTDYFSSSVAVNNVSYFGYYIPLRNSNESIIGMIFVGKMRQTVMDAVLNAVLQIFIVIAVITAVASMIALNYANKIVYSLSKTKEFLKGVASGDIQIQMDSYLLKRNDEIGEMGRFAIILQKWIIELVSTDPLTGLKNRWSYNKVLPQIMQEYRKGQTVFVLAVGDIDGFKKINDQYGHMAGDKVLKELSAIFTDHMKNRGHVFRWGGEEFLFIFERTCKEIGIGYLEEILKDIRSKIITYKGQAILVTMTFGVVECSETDNCEELIIRADENLYRGKANGKNRIVNSQQ